MKKIYILFILSLCDPFAFCLLYTSDAADE